LARKNPRPWVTPKPTTRQTVVLISFTYDNLRRNF
jgi:hypothetical protein